jgi:hypothetical protein
MKKLVTFLSIFTLILFFTACGNDEHIEEEVIEEVVEPFVDDANAETTAADTSSTGVYQEEVNENEETSLQDAMSNNNSEPKVEEGGMSFCDCVKKNKELTDIMMSDGASDEEFDKAMADLEAMKTGECKIMFASKQNTIEEKQAHERKVKRCLNK